jgi:hypothetical protein
MTPCKIDNNGECFICDCWSSDCAWKRLLNENYKWESREELLKMFQDYIRENNLNKILND